jgi:IclR family transcriptional regulator, KDG regulon repressor
MRGNTSNPASRSGAAPKAPGTRPAAKTATAAAAPKSARKDTAARHPSAKDVKLSTTDLAAREREVAREAAVASVNRAFDLLEVLARGGPIPLGVLAETAHCGKTAALEALAPLQARNFVIQDEANGLWRLGARWAALGRAASEQGALAATAMPFLIALGHATGENVYLRVREGLEVETAAIYQTDPNLRIYTEVGKKMPLHAGTGRLLLAHAPETVQTQILAQRLQRYTPSTRTDPNWIAADLHRIRQRGFLITDSEVVAGTVTVCAPVSDASGQVIAVLLIAAPSLRMRPPRPRALMPAVVDAARNLSRALGAEIPDPPAQTPVESAIEARRHGEMGASAWTATAAMAAATARPHSIFR